MKKEKTKFTFRIMSEEEALAQDMEFISEAYRMDVNKLNILPDEVKKEIGYLFLSGPRDFENIQKINSKINYALMRIEDVPMLSEFMGMPIEDLQELSDDVIESLIGVYCMEKDISSDDVVREHLEEQLEYELSDNKDEENNL